MARVAFVMDRVMRFTGLHGKSFMPMILGFGCAVPAIYSTRTLESRNQRILTSLVLPLMSCSARLPVYIIFGLAFFGAAAGNVITGLYIFGIVLAAIVATVMSRTILKERDDSVFALELPPVSPAHVARVLWRHTWQKTREFIVKAGTVIFTVVIILWFAHEPALGRRGPAGQLLRPSQRGHRSDLRARGLRQLGSHRRTRDRLHRQGGRGLHHGPDLRRRRGGQRGGLTGASTPTVAEDVREIDHWASSHATANATKATISLVPGIDLMAPTEVEPEDTELSAALQAAFSPLAAVGFVLFVLIYTPCVATLGAIRAEFGWRWAALSGAYQFAIAWLLAVVVFQVGTFLGFG